jgi:undecaprenyl pyrophosphate phosphatase UppP
MPLEYFAIALIVVGVVGWLTHTTHISVPEGIRTIVNIVLVLIVVGMALWLINTYVPMAESIRAILNLVVVIATCVGVLQAVGLWSGVVRLWSNLTHRISH